MHRGFINFTMGAVLLFCAALFAGEPMAMPKTPDSAKMESGTVVETMKVPGYTYMLVDNGAGQSWVAIPETDVATGAKVRYSVDMTMNNFTSKTLNKTFETIVFSAGLVEDGGKITETGSERLVRRRGQIRAAKTGRRAGHARRLRRQLGSHRPAPGHFRAESSRRKRLYRRRTLRQG